MMRREWAEIAWVVGIIIIGLVHVAWGVIDCWLWYSRQPTITHFLRAHPQWFFWPACAHVAFFSFLAGHLFWR
jgi:hypothetical protein